MHWFRFYNSVLDDEKVQCLPLEIRWGWVNLLCLASEQKERGTLPSMNIIGWKLRLTADEANHLIETLENAELIDEIDGVLWMHNWKNRQPKSDNGAERTALHRARKAGTAPDLGICSNDTGNESVTLHVTRGVTPLELELEQELNTSSSGSKGERIKPNYAPTCEPYQAAKRLADKIRASNPRARTTTEATLQSWADIARLIHERDGQSYADICHVIDWAQESAFWHDKILSMGKVREKWEQLTAQAFASPVPLRSNGAGDKPFVRPQYEQPIPEYLRG
jgi:hypothetical protein